MQQLGGARRREREPDSVGARSPRPRYARSARGWRHSDQSDVRHCFPTGRLLTMTDPKAQITTYTYFADGAFASTVYSPTADCNAEQSPSCTTPITGGSAMMIDGTGLTSEHVQLSGQPTRLPGQVANVDGPLTDDTITYAYDETRPRDDARDQRGRCDLGIRRNRPDRLPRRISWGTFTYTHEGTTTTRAATITYPNAQTTGYTYFGNGGGPSTADGPPQIPERDDAVKIRLHVRCCREHRDVAPGGRGGRGACGPMDMTRRIS